jgi:predicted nucleic acid-binding protein
MMKKVFLDTNILIDYFARRGQFFQPAAQIVQLGQDRQCELLVSALSSSMQLR